MHMAVDSIQAENFFMTQEDMKVNQAFAQVVEDQNSMAKNEDASSARAEMLAMGNNLVELTDQILKHSQKFFKSFNKQFTYVKLESFIFQEADYLEVAIKEVEEIGKIFSSYEIQMNRLKNTHLYQKSATVLAVEAKQRVEMIQAQQAAAKANQNRPANADPTAIVDLAIAEEQRQNPGIGRQATNM